MHVIVRTYIKIYAHVIGTYYEFAWIEGLLNKECCVLFRKSQRRQLSNEKMFTFEVELKKVQITDGRVN